MPTVARTAPAKVNLALSVGDAEPADRDGAPNPRAGWHPIASWMACLSLGDDVAVTPRPGPSALLREWAPDAPRPSPIDWPADRDLAMRALRALERRAQRGLPCEIRIRKRIPVGGGLGGGSSDAGAVLLALRQAFSLPLTDRDLADVAAGLGSDVPFFTDPDGAPAVISGFGERTEPAPRIRGDLTLVFPPFACPTPAVYKAFDALPKTMVLRPELQRIRDLASSNPDPALWFNDLEPAAEEIEPGLASIRRALAKLTGARTMLTGSGSTLIIHGAQHAPAVLAAAQRDLWSGGPLAGCAVLPATFLEEV